MVVSIWRIDQLEKFVLSLDDRKRRQKGDHVSLKYEKGGGGVVQVVLGALSIVSIVAVANSNSGLAAGGTPIPGPGVLVGMLSMD